MAVLRLGLCLVNTHIGATLDLSRTILDIPMPEVPGSTWSLLKREDGNARLADALSQ